jgi:Uma2 family endonuclease
MITNFNQLDIAKQYTYADYLTWKFSERVELWKGMVLKMNQATSSRHQTISINLATEFKNYLRKKTCRVFAAPFDVRLMDTKKSTCDTEIITVVQPDICIICDEQKIDEKGCIGSPDLIVEIVSKGNTKKELETKFALYEENGVQEYWIVQQGDETVVVFDLVDNKYQFRKIYSNDSIIPVGIFKDLEINLAEIF